MTGGAFCTHDRTGLVSNQDPSEDWDRDRPLRMRATCDREVCQQQALGWVAESGEPGHYYDDAERREAQEASA